MDSDVDLLIGFAPGAKSFDRLLALSDLFEERLGRRVGVVTIEALSPFLGPRILAEAMSFEPHDYLRHIFAEADYLLSCHYRRT